MSQHSHPQSGLVQSPYRLGASWLTRSEIRERMGSADMSVLQGLGEVVAFVAGQATFMVAAL